VFFGDGTQHMRDMLVVFFLDRTKVDELHFG
jgi:hypothetical protein